jgi:hypothetical protein
MRPLLLVLLAALGGLCLSAPVSAQGGKLTDSGRFVVYERGRAVATEDFEFWEYADSLVILAETSRKVTRADGGETMLEKVAGLIANAADFDLRRYSSSQGFGPDTTRRGILPDDTLMTVFVESPIGGNAERMVRPPGRLFVMDPQVWTLLDVIGRVLNRQTFDRRPVPLVVFSDPPAATEATATRLAPDTLRWGGKRVIARRLELKDESVRFLLWMSPEGRMLKLEQPETQLRVLREAPRLPPPARRRRD